MNTTTRRIIGICAVFVASIVVFEAVAQSKNPTEREVRQAELKEIDIENRLKRVRQQLDVDKIHRYLKQEQSKHLFKQLERARENLRVGTQAVRQIKQIAESTSRRDKRFLKGAGKFLKESTKQKMRDAGFHEEQLIKAVELRNKQSEEELNYLEAKISLQF